MVGDVDQTGGGAGVRGATPAIPALVSVLSPSPCPMPKMIIGIAMPVRYGVSTETRAIHAVPISMAAAPTTDSRAPRCRGGRRPGRRPSDVEERELCGSVEREATERHGGADVAVAALPRV